MSLAVVYSRAALALDAPLVTVEVHLSGGVPRTTVVGLPEAAVRESRDRVRGALQTMGYTWPDKHITVNLAPAELPKHGARFDLAIAVGVLCAAGHVSMSALESVELLGELALTGELRPVGASLPAALAARDAGRALVLTHADAPAAGLARGVCLLPANRLGEVCEYLDGVRALEPWCGPSTDTSGYSPDAPDLGDVRGQSRARRALEVAAAGGHALLMFGPPGTGKTMLATRLPGILPRMSESEALTTAAIRSVSGHPLDLARWRERPFRAPHHSASAVALVGGGSLPRPGEISLAHNGVLFLDELPEYDRRVLESLREPLESGRVLISRAARQSSFPAAFQLIAAMNPCPCGRHGDGSDRCGCTPAQIRRYRERISGPLLDRIDLQVETVPAHPVPGRPQASAPGEPSAAVRTRVAAAAARQQQRQGCRNARLDPARTREHCRLAAPEQQMLEQAVHHLALSARASDRVQRVARSIADLAGADAIAGNHLAEALSYRELERRRG